MIIQKFRRFMKGKRGQGMSEYIIMVGLVAIAAIGIFTIFGDQIRNTMNAMGMQLAGSNGEAETNELLESGDQANKTVTLGNFENPNSNP